MHAQVWEPLVKKTSVLSLRRGFRLSVMKLSRGSWAFEEAAWLLPVTSQSSQQNMGSRVIRLGSATCHLQAVQLWGGWFTSLSFSFFLK